MKLMRYLKLIKKNLSGDVFDNNVNLYLWDVEVLHHYIKHEINKPLVFLFDYKKNSTFLENSFFDNNEKSISFILKNKKRILKRFEYSLPKIKKLIIGTEHFILLDYNDIYYKKSK